MNIEAKHSRMVFSGEALLNSIESFSPIKSTDSISFRKDVDGEAPFFADFNNVGAAIVLLLDSSRNAMINGGDLTLIVRKVDSSSSEIVVEDSRQLSSGSDHCAANYIGSTGDGNPQPFE